MAGPARSKNAANAASASRVARALRRARAAVALLALGVALAGAAQAPAQLVAQAAGRAAPPGAPALGVGLGRCTFTDPTRTTFDYRTGATTPGRVLETEIRYPSTAASGEPGEVRGAPAATRLAPFPTVFFAPGYDVTPDAYRALLDAWVRAGFVVVAPSFPDTNPTAVREARVGGSPEDDIVNQPADLAFLVRAALRASATPDPSCEVLHGLVDPAAVALSGQSDGGSTVAMLEYDRASSYASLTLPVRIRAAAVLSGSEEPGTGPYEATVGDPPLLVVQSATDQCNPPQESVQLYEAIVQKDRWFLALRDADHLPPYDGTDRAAFSVVAGVTTRFFDLELRGATTVASFVAHANASPHVASLTTGPDAPRLPALDFEQSACHAR